MEAQSKKKTKESGGEKVCVKGKVIVEEGGEREKFVTFKFLFIKLLGEA